MSIQDTTAAAQVTHADDSGTTVTTALYTAAIGPISLDYYLPIFCRFEAVGRGGPAWNLAACLYTLNWLIFRRMWRAAWAYAAVILCCLLLLLALGNLWPSFYDAHEIGLWCGFGIFYFLFPGIYGNQLLYAATRKNVLHALTVSSTLKGACEKLSFQATSRGRFIWLVLINMLLASSAMGVYLVLQDIGALDKRAMFTDETGQQAKVTDKKPAPISATAATFVPTSAPALAPSTPTSTAGNGHGLMLSRTESTHAISIQADLAVMDAAALRYVPRRPLNVSATASASGVAGAAGLMQPSAPSPQAASLYYINVGLFANDWNARYAQAKLVDAGLVSFRQALMTSKGKLTRVRAGPFDSKAEAEAAAQKIHELKLDAVVIRQ